VTFAELPSWLRYRTGKRPIVIVAPHGGERAREIRRGDGMNDIYTAELCHELARRLDAYSVVNEGLDRNDVDLNRISAVVERAPEMLRVLRDAVTRAGAGAATNPLVLFVHGWNVSSLACDIGIGLRESGGELQGKHATVSRSTLRSFVEPLRDALAEQGLEGFVGHRYPASGRDNATQIFSGRHVGHDHADVDHLSRLALEGRVDAVQLELSIPLRWPGEYRARWLAAVEAAIEQYLGAGARPMAPVADGDAIAARKWASPPAARRVSSEERGVDVPRADGESVQAVLADGSGLFMGVEAAGPGALAARVCIARPGGELALFVCEAPWHGSPEHFAAGGLDWRPGLSVRYRGPAVLYDTHDAFVDLEGGLRSARVIEVEVEVPLSGGDEFVGGSVGYVSIDGRSLEISPLLVRRSGGRFTGEHGVRGRVFLAERGGGVIAVEETVSQSSDHFDGKRDPRRVLGRITFSDTGRLLSVQAEELGVEVRGRVTVAVPVYRPVSDGGFVKVVFGVAELAGNDRLEGHALFELVRRVRANPE
jgi:hypothetical protein